MWRVNFTATATESRFTIPIIQDSITENTEDFSLKIVIESPLDERVSVGEPSILRVLITGVCCMFNSYHSVLLYPLLEYICTPLSSYLLLNIITLLSVGT